MKYNYAMEKTDYKRIDILNCLKSEETFWDDVRECIRISRQESDHALRRWEILAERRFVEIQAFDIIKGSMEYIGTPEDMVWSEIGDTDTEDLKEYIRNAKEN